MIYAFFDFDGTLTKKDTLKGFAQFYWGKAFKWKLFSFLPILIGFKLKLINHNQAKSLFVRFFYKNQTIDQLLQAGLDYNRYIMPDNIQPAMMERLNWHLNQGHEVCIVTASLPYWIAPWCKQKGVNLIATQAEEINGRLTGHLYGTNCFGQEKVIKIQQEYEISPTDNVYAYGDTESDYPMMDMAHEAFDCSNNPNSPYTLARKEPWYAKAI
ncbi:HAD-IB family hydrolase [Oceaniserpentilla sp. 4NH20-0058]|uniref:HAD-IB family hydrolase n=1 Tax=Oceaniserpentilla sp. 4NH20-0058 TaxID=3127660 RepID=UPI00310AECB1